MRDINNLCPGCMRDNPGGGVCPHCGFDRTRYEVPAHHLKPGTILNGKYLLGKSIGEGGFGITYIGWDLNLEMKVAIKEYFPSGFVTRNIDNTDTVTIFSGSDRESYERGKNKFVDEAKTLAKFDNHPGIVSVKDFFLENGTAYISMEFVDGESLKDFLIRNGGRTSPDTIFAMMQPLMKSLIEVHKTGIIHRDISPDNIMITGGSNVKLLDFGAARDVSGGMNKSLSIQLKPGYAPEEQYRTHGKQGPWTDVYALSATIYRAITGIPPVESLERLQNDTLQRPSALGVRIDPVRENAIMQGMAVYAKDRLQSVEALYQAIYAGVMPNANNRQYQQNGNMGGYNQNYGNNGGFNNQQQYNNTQHINNNRGVYNAPLPNNNNNIYGNQQYNQPKKNKDSVKIVLTIVIAVLAAALVGGTVFVALSHSGKKTYKDMSSSSSSSSSASSTAQQEPTAPPTDEPAQTELPTEKPVPTPPPAPPQFRLGSFSSEHASSNDGVSSDTYYASHVIDGDIHTAWIPVCEDDGLRPIGHWVELNADYPQSVNGITIVNGFAKNERKFFNNYRVKDIKIIINGNEEVDVELSDLGCGIEEYIPLGKTFEATSIRIVIASVYETNPTYKEAAISEIIPEFRY